MRLLVTRPEPDASAQAATLRILGHHPVVSPLLATEFLKPPLELYRAQALIATSRNGLRALDSLPQREQARELPLFAVGEATAKLAAGMGFAEVIEGPGTAKGLAETIAATREARRGPLIQLAGEDLAFDLGAALERFGFTVETPRLYRMVPAASFSPEAAELLSGGLLDGVILMSPRTAKVFAGLARNLGNGFASLYGFCLSASVAAEIGGLGLAVRIASAPRSEELLALIAAEASSS